MGRDEQFIRRIRRQALTAQYPPIAGGSPEGEGEGEGGGGGEGEGEGEGDDDDELARTKAEANRLKREAADRAKKDRKAEADRKKAEEKAKAEQGQYQTLAEERQSRIEELEAEVESLKTQMVQGDQRRSLESVADDLGFKRPKRVWAILQDELGDEFDTTIGDETLVKNALRKLARDEPELVDQQRRSGAPGGGARQRNGKSDPSAEHNALVANLFGAPVQ